MKYTFFVNNSSPVAFRQRVLAFAALFVFCGLCATAYGQERVVQFTNNSIHPHTVTVNYPDDVCAVTAPSYAISAGTNTLTFSAGTASPFQIIRQSESEDCSITADFLPNTKVLAVNTVTQGFRPALTVAFSVGVTEMEFQAQIFGFGTERFTFEVFNGEESLAVFTVEDRMDYTQTGQRGYIGARTSGNDVITKVKVWAEFPDDPKHNEAVSNKFAIGPVSFRLDRDQ
jgi:hypothetical protein